MSIIYSYKKQKTLNAGDMLVGTSVEKVGGKQKNLTRNFTLQQVADFLNIKGKISISGQMTFKFTNNLIPLGGEFSGPAFDSDIVNITTVQISSVDVSSQNTTAFMQYLVGTDILISEQNNIAHNLKRFPSITVIDTANTVVVGEYEYIDSSNVTLKFLAGFAGKAYLN